MRRRSGFALQSFWAGALGFEPRPRVLETPMLAVKHQTPKYKVGFSRFSRFPRLVIISEIMTYISDDFWPTNTSALLLGQECTVILYHPSGSHSTRFDMRRPISSYLLLVRWPRRLMRRTVPHPPYIQTGYCLTYIQYTGLTKQLLSRVVLHEDRGIRTPKYQFTYLLPLHSLRKQF